MLIQRDFRGLVNRFGYALAYGRKAAEAVEADFRNAPSATSGTPASKSPLITVKYFTPNSTNLFALVECVVPLPDGVTALLELIVSNYGEERHITLEDIFPLSD